VLGPNTGVPGWEREMIDFILNFPRELANVLNVAICVLAFIILILLLSPLLPAEKHYSEPSAPSSKAKPLRILVACLSAWLIDASLFALPAMAITGSFFLLGRDFCMDPRVTYPDLRDDLTGTPSNIILKCFLAALNPFWFSCWQAWNICHPQQAPAIYPYTNIYGQIFLVLIEVVFPLALFCAYKYFCAVKYGGSIGSIIVEHENESAHCSAARNPLSLQNIISSMLLGVPNYLRILQGVSGSSSGERVCFQTYINKGKRNRWFVVSTLSLIIVATSQVFTYLEQIRRVESQTSLAITRFSYSNSSDMDRCTSSLFLLCSLRYLYAKENKTRALSLLEQAVSKLPENRAVLKEIEYEKKFVNAGNPFGYIRKFYFE